MEKEKEAVQKTPWEKPQLHKICLDKTESGGSPNTAESTPMCHIS